MANPSSMLSSRSGLLAALILLPAGAWAQVPAPAPKAPPPAAKPKPAPLNPGVAAQPAPDPAYEAARIAFEGLPEATRKGIQDALVWTGDYNAVTAGTFGRRTFEGIAAWQKRVRAEPTGILSAPQRGALDAAGEAAREAARFKVQADGGSGVVIGVPEKLLSKRSSQPGGARWQSADGRVTLDTKSFKQNETDLDALFERVTATGPDRKITYKLKKPDFLVVTGETATGRFYIRYASGIAGIRGFTVGYDKAVAAETDRLVIAIANSFVPFPQETPPQAHPGLAATPATPLAPRLPARPTATGLAISPAQVVTAASALDGCARPLVGGLPARLVKRDASGALALLETAARPGRSPVVPAPRADAAKPDEALVVVGAEAKGASVAPGVAGNGSVFAPLQPGSAGAPVIDRSGRLVGLVARFPNAPRLVAGVMPPTSYALVPTSAVSALLNEAGVPASLPKSAPPETLGAVAAPIMDAVVPIGCER